VQPYKRALKLLNRIVPERLHQVNECLRTILMATSSLLSLFNVLPNEPLEAARSSGHKNHVPKQGWRPELSFVPLKETPQAWLWL
jgi:hypothetical protein